jgi:SAM-dependent methyltransferase
MKPVSLRSRSIAAIAAEWDQLAGIRARQIASGSDHSARSVLRPAVLRLLGRTTSVVDVGCGTGWLTAVLTRHAREVVGVDVSSESIRLARRDVRKSKVKFVNMPIEKFAKSHPHFFTAAVANMTLGTVGKLSLVLAAVNQCLNKGGVFIVTIPHPCFWPLYWGYAEAPWFNYNKEIAIRAPFRIASEGTPFETTHVHRPLSQYIYALKKTGFDLELLEELVGIGFAPPRFIAMRCQKVG